MREVRGGLARGQNREEGAGKIDDDYKDERWFQRVRDDGNGHAVERQSREAGAFRLTILHLDKEQCSCHVVGQWPWSFLVSFLKNPRLSSYLQF